MWSLLRRGRPTPPLPLPGPCGYGRHTLRTPRLLLYTPETILDIVAVMSGGSDPEAQRWLGWDKSVSDPRVRRVLSRLRPGDPDSHPDSPHVRRLLADPYRPGPEPAEVLIGVCLDDGRYAGATEVRTDTGEIGGWLAPHARGRGLGSELFGAAALLGHVHLGLRTVRAGYEPANTASGRALTAAGFAAADGPPRHTLQNGREIDARWLIHTVSGQPTRC